MLISIGTVFLFDFVEDFSGAVEILFSEFDFKGSFALLLELSVFDEGMGGGTGVITGWLLVGSLFTRRT